ncbi:pyruvate kinase [Mycolicibacterium aubagnense]
MLNMKNDVEPTSQQLKKLLDDVDELLTQLSAAECTWSRWLTDVTAEHRSSARNMVHYWAIRQSDLRDLQFRLSAYGLSSLGRSEPHVEATLTSVRSAISAMLGDGFQPPIAADSYRDGGADLLRNRTQELLGPDPVDRGTRIMVTLPSSAAVDPALVRQLVESGMNIARINCAHDDADAWRSMARHVRQAAEDTGRSCLVAMDLAGPKIRTGPLEPGPRCVKLRPDKDQLGQVTAPARAWLTTTDEPMAPPEAGMPSIKVPGTGLTVAASAMCCNCATRVGRSAG